MNSQSIEWVEMDEMLVLKPTKSENRLAGNKERADTKVRSRKGSLGSAGILASRSSGGIEGLRLENSAIEGAEKVTNAVGHQAGMNAEVPTAPRTLSIPPTTVMETLALANESEGRVIVEDVDDEDVHIVTNCPPDSYS